LRLAEQFDPITVGEIDNFGFDFTGDCGSTYIIAVAWTCRLSPYSQGFDPDPQSRVLSAAAVTSVTRQSANGVRRQTAGQFAVAQIGGMPASAAGATYILSAVAELADGRTPERNSTVQCVLPGQ
jgi:hypothetical protein